MQKVIFPYGQGKDGGNGFCSLDIPQEVIRYGFSEPEKSLDEKTFRLQLRDLLAAQLNEQNEQGLVAVVVADKTRLCGYTTVLPWVVEVLHELGVERNRIAFYIAYGTHPRQSDEECLESYGEVYKRYRFIHHDCRNVEQFKDLGCTSRGTPVRLRKDLCSARLILTVGAISHHYFAGYGGGRKLIFPGLGERQAIYANHGLFLDVKRSRLAEGCRPGNLRNNPLAEDLFEVHSRMPQYLSIHTILNSRGEAARFAFGQSYQDFLRVCDELDGYYTVEHRRHELVIASAGGFPKDINFIQSHKSIHNAAPLVKDGGTLIMFAQCRDGVGSETFLPYFRLGGRQAAFQELAQRYAGNGGTALAMMEKTERIRILMVTDLNDDICREIGVEKISPAVAQEKVGSFRTTGPVGVVANSSLLVARRLDQAE